MNIRVSSFSHPNFTTPLLEEVKTKLLGLIANHKPKSPRPNLTKLELRGRKWLMDKISSESLFVTKAAKGGPALIKKYTDVKIVIEKELSDNQKLSRSADEQLGFMKDEVRSLVTHLGQRKITMEKDFQE